MPNGTPPQKKAEWLLEKVTSVNPRETSIKRQYVPSLDAASLTATRLFAKDDTAHIYRATQGRTIIFFSRQEASYLPW